MYLKSVCVTLCRRMTSNFDNTFPSTVLVLILSFSCLPQFYSYYNSQRSWTHRLNLFFQETQFYPETVLKLTAPCILPELQLIRKVGRQTHTWTHNLFVKGTSLDKSHWAYRRRVHSLTSSRSKLKELEAFSGSVSYFKGTLQGIFDFETWLCLDLWPGIALQRKKPTLFPC